MSFSQGVVFAPGVSLTFTPHMIEYPISVLTLVEDCDLHSFLASSVLLLDLANLCSTAFTPVLTNIKTGGQTYCNANYTRIYINL